MRLDIPFHIINTFILLKHDFDSHRIVEIEANW